MGACQLRPSRTMPVGLNMVRMTGIRVASFLILAVVGSASRGALCQEHEPAAWNSLPDAPVAQTANTLQSFSGRILAADRPSALRLQGLQGINEVHPIGASWTASYWVASYKEDPTDANDFRRQLTELLRHQVSYRPSESGSLIRRATSAALETFFTRDPSGKSRLNTSYFVGVLTSAVIHTAYRPYWNRPVSAPFSDFGSTVGNDAGMNLLHEFRPGLEQLLKSHTPKFVSRIEASIEHK
jgi:hypothetical protein